MEPARKTDAMKPEPRPELLNIVAYKPGESEIPGHDTVIKLASNESPLGPSPKAVAAIRDHLDHLELYPDGGSVKLVRAIAEAHELDPAHVLAASGSEQLLGFIARAYLAPGDEVIHTAHGFLVYKIATLAAGAAPVAVPEADYTADVDAILGAVTERTKIVFLANPNNPTGTVVPYSEVKRLREGLPDRVLLVLDVAYAEYLDRPDYDAGDNLVRAAIASGLDNVIVTRTFSKIYGLAALRIGWAHLPPTASDAINRIREVFNVSTLAQAAGIAAVADQDHVAAARAHNARWLPWLTQELTVLGVYVVPSAGNFLLARFAGGPEEAAEADAHLRENGIIVRPVAGYGLADCLRITVGSEAQNHALIAAFKKRG